MNILLLGSGGREHALAWRLAQSRCCDRLYAAPGNPGIAEHAELVVLDSSDHRAVVAFCERERVSFVVIGPEAPLVDGLADSLRAAGVAVFGPSRAAARLEGSKAFTKELCARAGIPTAAWERVSNEAQGRAALIRFGLPVVVKADGLAAGKGVTVAETRAEAEAALAEIFSGRFGTTGVEAVVEEFLEGEEASLFALTDGITIVPFGSAQDHKRVGEGDTGPNTGGMGAYSPAPVLTPLLEGAAIATIIAPTVRAMAEAGMPYSGVLYAGLMLTDDGPKLIEYNCRFGDPECQVLMMRLESDLGELLLACAKSRLAACQPPRFSSETALTVVMAAAGYPDEPRRGGTIAGLDVAEAGGARVFHAGTARREDGRLVASGGRVLNVTARGSSVREAQARAYAGVDSIDFPEGFCRRDIGWRELARERQRPLGKPGHTGDRIILDHGRRGFVGTCCVAPRCSSSLPRRKPVESTPLSKKGRGWLAGGALAAAAGVAAAVYNQGKTKAAERRTPPVGRFAEVDGVRVHYLRSGKGPPIVLIHGNGVMLQDWIVPGIFDELARDHDVIAVDRPGFGYSARPRTTVWTPQKQAELLAKLLRQLGVEKACVVGHSFGTMVALALALDHSELVERLVLLDGYYFPSPRVDLLAQTGPAIPIVGDLIRFTLAPPAARAAMPLAQKAMFSPAAVSPAWREHFPVDMVVRPLQIRATAADYAVAIPSAWSLSRRYGELNLPMTIIHGVGDKIASFAGQGKRLHETIPGSRLVPVEGVGHMVHYSAMATVLREITSNRSGPGQSGVVLPVLEQESQGTGEAVGVIASEVPARDLVARPV